MSAGDWVMAAAFTMAIVFVGVAFAVLYPEWPPIEPGVHRHRPRGRPRPRPRVAFLDEELEERHPDGPLPLGPAAEEWMWTTEGQKRHRPRHRYDDLGQGTIRMPWYERPETGEQPLYPDV